MICGLSYSQEHSEEPLPDSFVSVTTNSIVEEGTYQVILFDNRMVEPVLNDEILHQIVDLRDSDEITFIQLSDYSEIRILPFSIINSDDFSPLEMYSYED